MSSTALLVVDGITKHFGSEQPALDDVSLEIGPGEIHGLVGQNGSGKSTLIKILAGYHDPDPGGRLWVNDGEVGLPLAPGDFRKHGMSFVHQNLGLADSLSILDNLRIGLYRTGRLGRITWRRERRAARAALRRFDLKVDPETKVGSLPEASRAIVAIARATEEIASYEGRTEKPGLLILDEPTPYLSRDAVASLFDAVRGIVRSGTGCLFVSHRLDEVYEITDKVTVLRDGVVAGSGATSEIANERLIELIIGRQLEDLYPEAAERGTAPALTVRDLSGPRVEATSFDLAEGEVLGLTGLVGMGFEDVPYLLYGAARAYSGDLITAEGTAAVADMTPRRAMTLGIVLVPAHRERDGGVSTLTLGENITLPRLSDYFRRFHMQSTRERHDAQVLAGEFQVRPPDPGLLFGSLSGGNQQKAIVGKWLAMEPRVLLLHEPTQGVDIGARKQLFSHIRRAADDGAGVVIVSIEYEDLAHLCDRVLIFHDGRVGGELRGAQLTKERILEQSFSSTLGARAQP